MQIEPIGSIDGLGSSTATAALNLSHLQQAHASPAEIALAVAEEKEVQTTDERAANGDPIAISEMAQAEALVTPIQSQQLEPAALKQSTGIPEVGKGNLVDLYD